jgi:hypothetical protein
MMLTEKDSAVHQERILKEKQDLRDTESASAYLTNFDNHAYEQGYFMTQRGTSVGSFGGRMLRHGNAPGAFFQYDLPIVEGVDNFLNSTLASGDRNRSWRILINGEFFENEVVASVATPSTFCVSTKKIPSQYTTGEGVRKKTFNNVEKPYVTVRFERIEGYVGGIFGISMTQGTYDANPNLRELTFDAGKSSPAFDPHVKAYTLQLPPGTASVNMKATPWMASGLVYNGDILIDDVQLRTIPTQTECTLVINTKAQDHTTATAYEVKICHVTPVN